jgi:SPP1 gp7 family putative phage head morphogenesis protein
MIRGFDLSDLVIEPLLALLRRYAELITPWATSVANRMVVEVAARDKTAWSAVAQQMGINIERELLASGDIGTLFRRLQDEQVTLIKSLPLEAAQRVQRIAQKAFVEGHRVPDLVDDILRTGDIVRSRARLIARTETSRVATNLTQARAQFVGSEGYIWGTAKDDQVRPSHRTMEGKFVRWDSPPTLDNLTGHAGALPNCRCVCYPTIDISKYR